MYCVKVLRKQRYIRPTYSITPDFDWGESENSKLLFQMAAKYGIPYFSNYINSDMKPSDVRSMCCRLRLDLRELRKKTGGFFGSGENTGSIGVVTINLPRLAYESATKAEFFVNLDKMMDIAARSLKIKRDVLSELLEGGLYPYTKYYLGNFDNHFSTIGLVGMNECGLNAAWLRKDMTHPETQEFAVEVLNHMRERLSDYQEQYGDLYNLEATPAEGTSYRFAKHDVEEYPDIITANMNGTPYYTNSTNLPVGYTDDIFSALDVQDELQTLYTSGTVFHAYLGEKLPDWRAARDLVRKIAENYRLPYYTLSPTYSICKDHGYLDGEQPVCPYCGKKTEIFSRITGYYRAVQNWNDGKTQEFKDRKTYEVATSKLQHDGPMNALPHQFYTQEDDGHCCGPDGCNLGDVASVSATDPHVEQLTLVTTKTCPNCKIIKQFLDSNNIQYAVVLADEQPDIVKKFGIMQAPTLIIPGVRVGDSCSVISGVSRIMESLEYIKAASDVHQVVDYFTKK